MLTDGSNNRVTLGIQGSFVTRNFIIAGANGGSGTRITESTSQTVAPADFNADGRSDVLLHNTSSGAFVGWDMDGPIIASAGNLTAGAARWRSIRHGRSAVSAISTATAMPTFY